ncbi:MAG: MBL fold metallo-hydrolase [Patescibacteria group bacterium]|nr:MBL fold metallo-hydrolase [Patescibacteria group bacterium]
MLKINSRKIKIIITLALLSIIIYLSFLYFFSKQIKELKISFIDCGQADAILIQTPQNHNVIIDFGDDKGLAELNKKVPWWNKKINLMIITHPHDDHILGMISILKKYQVQKIMYTGVLHYSPVYLELLEEIKKQKIPLLIPQKNQIVNLGKDCNLKILYPIESFQGKEIANINNSSIVSKLECANKKFLFMGDAEIEVENELLANNSDLKSDVLKAGHHGSITSSQTKFIEKVKPEIVIIMVGKNNKFNHPSLRTLKRFQKLEIKTFRTDLDGTITIISDGQNIYLE